MMRPRNLSRFTGGLAAFFALALLVSCSTTNLASNKIGWSDYAPIAIKDYLVLGSVHVVSEEVIKRGFLGITRSHTGSQVTYDLLIKEAKKLGADDIINVRIDRKDSSVHGILDWIVGFAESYTYSANALAIKYTVATLGARAAGAPGSTSGSDLGLGDLSLPIPQGLPR